MKSGKHIVEGYMMSGGGMVRDRVMGGKGRWVGVKGETGC